MTVIKYQKTLRKHYVITSRRDVTRGDASVRWRLAWECSYILALHLISLLREDLALLHVCSWNGILLQLERYSAAAGTAFCCSWNGILLHLERYSAASDIRPVGLDPTTLNSFVGRHRLYHSASLQTLRALCLKA